MKTKVGTFAIFRFDGKGWKPMLPADVPAWLKEPDPMGDLAIGATLERDGQFYRAAKGPDSPLIIAEPRIRVFN